MRNIDTLNTLLTKMNTHDPSTPRLNESSIEENNDLSDYEIEFDDGTKVLYRNGVEVDGNIDGNTDYEIEFSDGVKVDGEMTDVWDEFFELRKVVKSLIPFEVTAHTDGIMTDGMTDEDGEYNVKIDFQAGDCFQVIEWYDGECGGRLRVNSKIGFEGLIIYVDDVRDDLQRIVKSMNYCELCQ